MKRYPLSQIPSKSDVTLALTLLVLLLNSLSTFLVSAEAPSESERYVRNFLNTPPYGNWTFIEKPMFPVHFNESQIPIGSNWTLVCPLAENHSYHIYYYGDWIDKTSNPKTDYDIYAFNPLGGLEGYHTESAGLPEHLGSDTEEPFFTARDSGNYSLVIRNDPRESNASKPATMMIIENVQCNSWQEAYIEGKAGDATVFNTSWAYEFITESQHVEVLVRVPETLDMYEARLYLMGNPSAGKGDTINEEPVAWEQGLYGKTSQIYGGYNVESKGYRGVSFASCEFYGQNMLINYTAPIKGKSLYHLVFIGEKGTGTINFIVRTEFGKPSLRLVNPPMKTKSNNETTLTFVSSCTDLMNATLTYSTNSWRDTTILNMQFSNKRNCSATIPGQPAGTTVNYKVEAPDIFDNDLTYTGNYTVKQDSQLSLVLKTEVISIGENITLTGQIDPVSGNSEVILTYTSTNETSQQTTVTSADGAFTASFKPSKEGDWCVQAVFEGSNLSYGSSSQPQKFKVTPPSFMKQYSTYIFAGAGVGGIIVASLVFIKKRRQ